MFIFENGKSLLFDWSDKWIVDSAFDLNWTKSQMFNSCLQQPRVKGQYLICDVVSWGTWFKNRQGVKAFWVAFRRRPRHFYGGDRGSRGTVPNSGRGLPPRGIQMHLRDTGSPRATPKGAADRGFHSRGQLWPHRDLQPRVQSQRRISRDRFKKRAAHLRPGGRSSCPTRWWCYNTGRARRLQTRKLGAAAYTQSSGWSTARTHCKTAKTVSSHSLAWGLGAPLAVISQCWNAMKCALEILWVNVVFGTLVVCKWKSGTTGICRRKPMFWRESNMML